MPSLYDVLGVPKDAKKEDIKKAYRKAAHEQHPDHGGDAASFALAAKAYRVLSNDEARKYYDETGKEKGLRQAGGLSKAEQVVCSTFAQVLGKLTPESVLTVDIIQKMTRVLEKDDDTAQTIIDASTLQIQALKKVRGKINRRKKKKGENILLMVLESQIVALQRAKEEGEEKQKLTKDALKILSEYSYNYDRNESSGLGSSPLGNWNWRHG